MISLSKPKANPPCGGTANSNASSKNTNFSLCSSSVTAHLFIINTFSGKDIKFGDLFRTHLSTEDR